jgi:hypothetical protein
MISAVLLTFILSAMMHRQLNNQSSTGRSSTTLLHAYIHLLRMYPFTQPRLTLLSLATQQHSTYSHFTFLILKMAEQSMNADSLTLEETNKVRASLGLAPIGGETEGTPEPDEDEIAEANYAKRREAEQKAKRDKEVQENIAQ